MPRALCGAFIALIVAAVFLTRDIDLMAALGEHRSTLLAWAETRPGTTVAFYVVTYVAIIVLSLPGAFAMSMTGGFLFGLLPGAALSVLSSTAGGLLVFLVARTALGEPVRLWLLSRGSASLFARAERGLRENAVIYLLLLRLVPAVPFTVANVMPAFFGISARLFVATTVVGVIPASAILASFGVGLGELIDRGGRLHAGLLSDPTLVGPLVGLGALAALPLVIGRVRRILPQRG